MTGAVDKNRWKVANFATQKAWLTWRLLVTSLTSRRAHACAYETSSFSLTAVGWVELTLSMSTASPGKTLESLLKKAKSFKATHRCKSQERLELWEYRGSNRCRANDAVRERTNALQFDKYTKRKCYWWKTGNYYKRREENLVKKKASFAIAWLNLARLPLPSSSRLGNTTGWR